MSSKLATDLLVFDGVSKAFGNKYVLQDVDLRVKAGEVFGFLGPNGAGKTTTIRLLLDVIRPTAGTITLFGQSNREVRQTHARLGFLSGDMIIDSNITGAQYLEFVSGVYRKDCRQNIRKLADLLQADLKVKIGNYSRGNKQKVGLIAALMHEPDLLVLDEPTSGFDPLVQEIFADLIRQFRQAGNTVFMSSHVLSEVQELCDRLAFIKDGKIITVTTTEKLTAQAAKRVKITAAPDVIQAMKAKHPHDLQFQSSETNDVINATYAGQIHPLLQYLSAHEIDDATIREPELEETFMHFYQGKDTPGGESQE